MQKKDWVQAQKEPTCTIHLQEALDFWATGASALSSEHTVDPLLLWNAFNIPSRYQFEKILGTGGMGVVFKCWDTWKRRCIALKLLHPSHPLSTREQLVRELSVQEQLQHDGIVQTFDMGVCEGTGRSDTLWFFTMEWVDGVDLEHWVVQRAKTAQQQDLPIVPYMTCEELANWLVHVSSCLSYAHYKGVIHRDLKPSNILMLPNGEIKLLDFGIATSPADSTSQIFERMGTAYYMAPELLTSHSTEPVKWTPAIDVYAVGAIVYWLLTGRYVTGRIRGPWEEWDRSGQYAPFPREIDEVILQALEPNPAFRFASIDAFSEALLPLLSERNNPAQTAQTVDTQSRSPQFIREPVKNQEVVLMGSEGATNTRCIEQTLQQRSIVSLETSLEIETVSAYYTFDSLLAEGELSDVYAGICHSGKLKGTPVVLKYIYEEHMNDWMCDEQRTLQLLHAAQGKQTKHLPVCIDSLTSQDGRMGLIFEALDAFDLDDVRTAFPQGLEPEHAVWVMRRTLSTLGYIHSLGVLHGNIEPAHILIRPHDHNVFLIDWSYAIRVDGASQRHFKCWNEVFSAPEVREQKAPLPSSDLYSLGKTMLFLLGGDLERHTFPDSVDIRLQRFIQFLLWDSPLQRARDAWELYHQLGRLRKVIFGPHQFIPFQMPSSF